MQQLHAQDTCLYVSRRSYKLQIGKLVNLIIIVEPRVRFICQVEVSASGRSHVQKSPTECGVCVCGVWCVCVCVVCGVCVCVCVKLYINVKM